MNGAERSLGRTRRIAARISRRSGGRVGIALLTLFLLGAALGPYVAPQDPLQQRLQDRLSAPNREHLLGTDEFGRDVLSRLLHGTRVSLVVGVVAVLIGVTVGGLLNPTATRLRWRLRRRLRGLLA
jgi:peptide/nickel transport system permease protein